MNVLFVCTGNICRSPVAEHLLRDLGASDPASLTVQSAGTAGMSRSPMDDRSLRYLADAGIDGTAFRARRVNRRILADADLIVGLEKSHVDDCLRLAPAALSRTWRLHQLAEWHRTGELPSLSGLPELRRTLPPVEGDHDDPVGYSSAEAYRGVLDGIARDVRELHALITAD
jgi:protein-tyrosine phosphatase